MPWNGWFKSSAHSGKDTKGDKGDGPPRKEGEARATAAAGARASLGAEGTADAAGRSSPSQAAEAGREAAEPQQASDAGRTPAQAAEGAGGEAAEPQQAVDACDEEEWRSVGGSTDSSGEEEARFRSLKVVCNSREDVGGIEDKVQEQLTDLGLVPCNWVKGPPIVTDAQGTVYRGVPNWGRLEFPVTLEVPVIRKRGAAPASDNPFDTGEYEAPTMTKEELAMLTVPFAQVSKQLRAVMEDHGAAIVTGVVSEEELALLEGEFTQDLTDLIDEEALGEAGPEADVARESFEAFRLRGPRAFPVKTICRLTAAAGFSVKSCLSQGRFAWRVRRHPNVQAVYQALYPEAGGDLVCSMDVTFFTPEGQPAREKNRFSAHVDQNSNDVRPGLADWESYQGVLYVWPSEADGQSSTTVVWPGSHKKVWPEMMKDECFKVTGSEGFHYSEIKEMWDKDAGRRLAAGWASHARRAVVPKGGLFLWNSRTVHTGWSGGPRLAQTVCFEPKSRRPEPERLAKLRLAALGLPSTHWASVGMQHDIVLGDAGYAAAGKAPARAWNPAGGLPLRPAIRPASLAENADVEALAELVGVDYRLTGMWEPPEDVADLLDASVKDEFKACL